MGTRSAIAICNTNGTFEGIYCHWDGYIEHNGKVLFENYTTEAKVRELIALGDLSCLGAEIGTKTDFINAREGQCVAYGRDRNEPDCAPGKYPNFDTLQASIAQEYTYIFDAATATWYVAQDSGLLVTPLCDAIAAEAAGEDWGLLARALELAS